MNILALDCATKTGWAMLFDGSITSGVVNFKKRKGESNGVIFHHFAEWLKVITPSPIIQPSFNLIVYEETHLRGAGSRLLVGMTALVMLHATNIGAECMSVHTGTLKKATTGYGNADKGAMKDWFWRTIGREPIDDNEADAMALLEYAITNYGGKR